MHNADMMETAMAIGYVRIIRKKADGRLISDEISKNQLTNYARAASAQLWAGQIIDVPNYIEVGGGQPTAPFTGPDPTDTNLWSAYSDTYAECDFVATWLDYNTQYSVTYDQNTANYAWTEVGLFDVNGNLWSHVSIDMFTKDITETVTVQWQIQHIAI